LYRERRMNAFVTGDRPGRDETSRTLKARYSRGCALATNDAAPDSSERCRGFLPRVRARARARGLMSRTSKPIVPVYQSAIGNTGLTRIITGERMLQDARACRLKFYLAIARVDKPRRHSII